MFAGPGGKRPANAESHDNDGIAQTGGDVDRLVRKPTKLARRKPFELADVLVLHGVLGQARDEHIVAAREQRVRELGELVRGVR